MAARIGKVGEARLAFEAIAIEGRLLGAEWLGRVAQLQTTAQEPADYRVPKGLHIRDEIARSWRIAQACFHEMESSRSAGGDAHALAEEFIEALLRDAFGFVSLTRTEPPIIDERQYPIRHFAVGGAVPIVIAPAGIGLDTPLSQLGDGRRRRSAFGLLQEFLNASAAAQWGLASDGYSIRIARDNASLTRPAWIEADIARIFTEDLYSDFAALWLLAHESRFGRAGNPDAASPLEIWREAGREEGTRARERLSAGFKQALEILGQGFLSHAANSKLRSKLQSGQLKNETYFEQLLRLVYRIIFLLTVEERDLLHPTTATETSRRIYANGYSLRRLRDRAVRRGAHDRQHDLWEAVKIVFRGLADGEPHLGLPALAGLFARGECPDLDDLRLENRALLAALFHLAWLREPAGLARVNWRDMGSDELGYIYEGLLELVGQIREDGRTFSFASSEESRGHARKTTGSYYTPDELVQLLLASALDPVVKQTLQAHPNRPAEALLELTIVDPACGSGHFLLAAARRLADHVARVRAGGTPTPGDYQHALRDVVRQCVYGVDSNPLAVELCKVSLWMESVDPGLPLTFLESHIRCGNSLIGTTRALMGDEVPEAAWAVLEGDDRRAVAALKRRNKEEIAGQQILPFEHRSGSSAVREAIQAVEQAPDTDAGALAEKERRWQELLASQAYEHEKLVADAWCAAFFWPKADRESPITEAAPTTATWRALRDKAAAPSPALVEITGRIANEYRFFHWELAFPHVFDRGGFGVVLGNPPWERVKLQEQEFFAKSDTSIANARNATERKKLIAALPTTDPDLWRRWTDATRVAQGQSHFVRASGRYPLCGKGDVNTYALFAEHNWNILTPHGRAGFIVPSGIATDDTTKDYFQALLDRRALASIYHFENEDLVFKGLHHAYRFVLMSLGRAEHADLVFYARAVEDIEAEERHFTLNPEDFGTLNPNTRTCPTFRSRRDAELNLAIYRRTGVLWHEGDPDGNPWGLRFMRMFDMANDSDLFRTQAELASAEWSPQGNRFVRDDDVMLPLYEAKMVHHFDHRFGTYEGQSDAQANQGKLPELNDAAHADPRHITLPRYWITEAEVDGRLNGVWDRAWLLGWRDITGTEKIRTVIASVVPRAAAGDTLLLMMPSAAPRLVACLYACLVSFPLDYAARQKVGGTHLKFHLMRQLPVLAPAAYLADAPWHRGTVVRDWILPRVLELTYTAWDLQPFAEDCGDDGAPFTWDPERRSFLRAELDAALFHLYGLSRDEADYVMDTFPIVRRRDEAAYGEYRTKKRVLDVYDALAKAAASGEPYRSPLGPPRRVQ